MKKLFSKYVLLFGLILFVPFVLAQFNHETFGGETTVLYENSSLTCNIAWIEVNSTSDVEFTPGGEREYNLLGCNHSNSLSPRWDNWTCGCDSVSGFSLTLSTLQNTINKYTFSGTFFKDNETNGTGPTGPTLTSSSSSSGGGGGGGTSFCSTQWTCTTWSECVDGIQTRVCDYSTGFCQPTVLKPIESQNCVAVGEGEPLQSVSPEGQTPITGGVIGAIGGVSGFLALLFVILIIAAGIAVIIVKEKGLDSVPAESVGETTVDSGSETPTDVQPGN